MILVLNASEPYNRQCVIAKYRLESVGVSRADR